MNTPTNFLSFQYEHMCINHFKSFNGHIMILTHLNYLVTVIWLREHCHKIMLTLGIDKEDIGGKSDELALSKQKTVIIDDANSKVIKYFLSPIFCRLCRLWKKHFRKKNKKKFVSLILFGFLEWFCQLEWWWHSNHKR